MINSEKEILKIYQLGKIKRVRKWEKTKGDFGNKNKEKYVSFPIHLLWVLFPLCKSEAT